MLQNLPIMLFSISQIFCLLCSFLCFPNMNYADNFYEIMLKTDQEKPLMSMQLLNQII